MSVCTTEGHVRRRLQGADARVAASTNVASQQRGLNNRVTTAFDAQAVKFPGKAQLPVQTP